MYSVLRKKIFFFSLFLPQTIQCVTVKSPPPPTIICHRSVENYFKDPDTTTSSIQYNSSNSGHHLR